MPFPGLDHDLGLVVQLLGRPSSGLAAIFRLADAARCRVLEPGLLLVVGRRDGRHDVAASHSSRFRLRDLVQAVEGVAVQSSSPRASARSYPRSWHPHLPPALSFSVFTSRPVAAYPQSRPSRHFLRRLVGQILVESLSSIRFSSCETLCTSLSSGAGALSIVSRRA